MRANANRDQPPTMLFGSSAFLLKYEIDVFILEIQCSLFFFFFFFFFAIGDMSQSTMVLLDELGDT